VPLALPTCTSNLTGCPAAAKMSMHSLGLLPLPGTSGCRMYLRRQAKLVLSTTAMDDC
jgi:hypothetical protein